MAPITDDEWADLVAQELPKSSDLVIRKYLESRSALMAEEQKQRSDHSFRQALSPIARRACDIVSRIRDEERRETNRAISKETTRSWQIIRRMPKGALLRAACHSFIDIDHLLDAALKTPWMHISCLNGNLATEMARADADLCFRFRKAETNPVDNSSLWADDYKPGTFVPLGETAESYPDGGSEGFVGWLKEKCTIPRQTGDRRERWRATSRCADVISGMLFYEPIWRVFLRQLMSNLVKDGVYWLELRLTFPLAYYRAECETPDPHYDHLFQALGEELARFQATSAGRPFWGLRVIWSTLRRQDPRSIIEDADSCIATKLMCPHMVAGYDLAGPECLGRSLADLLPELFWFRKQCAMEDVQIPFFLQAGGRFGFAESGEGAETESNLFDAILLGTRRIANAASLHRHPRLVEAVKDKRILVEASPVLLCGGGGTAEPTRRQISAHHPLPALLAQGVPCALTHDDGGFGIPLEHRQAAGSRTTDVFWQVLQTWDSIDLAGLGSLAENSVRWAAFEDQDAEMWAREIRAASVGAGVKSTRLQQWAVEWERFCLWIVTEYGDTYGEGSKDDEDADAPQ
ncbi:hypothetical protein VTI74DRAFT_7896 [Chaetomium olivicolor]